MAASFRVATRKGLFLFRKEGSGWQIKDSAFSGDPVTMILTDPRDGMHYAALNLGHFGVKMHRAPAGSMAFEEIHAPKYPKDEDGASLKLIWELTPSGADQPGTLWAGTIPGGLFRSDDRGETWVLNEPLWNRPEKEHWFGGGYDHPGIHSICVDPRDSKRLLVAVSCGGVWETRDEGQSWELLGEGLRAAYMPPDQSADLTIQDPHCMVQCAGAPDVLWVQHHNGIFRSGDGGRTWEEFTETGPSSFGFACAVHPENPDLAWFIPAVKDECRIPVDGALVVTRTRDGGNSFDVLNRGLPGAHCYDLIFRHALAVDETGDVLVFGSTTGNLWLSEDQGDHWQCLQTSLPPIYAIRFD